MTNKAKPDVALTAEQQNVVDFALTGHNMCILGRAGVGKTTVVKHIRKLLIAQQAVGGGTFY